MTTHNSQKVFDVTYWVMSENAPSNRSFNSLDKATNYLLNQRDLWRKVSGRTPFAYSIWYQDQLVKTWPADPHFKNQKEA